MKQVFDFEQFTPPILNERLLRRELEKRAARRRTVLLAVAGALFQAVFILLGVLCWNTIPALTLACIGFAIVSMVGSGVITIVYAQKGGVKFETEWSERQPEKGYNNQSPEQRLKKWIERRISQAQRLNHL